MDKLSNMDLSIIRCALQTELRVTYGTTVNLARTQLEDLYDRILVECGHRETMIASASIARQ